MPMSRSESRPLKVTTWSIQCQSFSRSSGSSPTSIGLTTPSIAALVAAQHVAVDALVGGDARQGRRSSRPPGAGPQAVAPARRAAGRRRPELDHLDIRDPHRLSLPSCPANRCAVHPLGGLPPLPGLCPPPQVRERMAAGRASPPGGGSRHVQDQRMRRRGHAMAPPKAHDLPSEVVGRMLAVDLLPERCASRKEGLPARSLLRWPITPAGVIWWPTKRERVRPDPGWSTRPAQRFAVAPAVDCRPNPRHPAPIRAGDRPRRRRCSTPSSAGYAWANPFGPGKPIPRRKLPRCTPDCRS